MLFSLLLPDFMRQKQFMKLHPKVVFFPNAEYNIWFLLLKKKKFFRIDLQNKIEADKILEIGICYDQWKCQTRSILFREGMLWYSAYEVFAGVQEN